MAVAVLFTASCAKEDISSSIGGGEVEVTFTASLPELGTRAYGEGKLAKQLTVNVYEHGTNEALTALNRIVTSETGTFTFQLVLLKGMKYDIVLWAQNATCGHYTLANKVVTMNYTDVNANDETRDAFYFYVEGFDPAVDTPSFALTRPFAQLNAAVNKSDMTAVSNSKVELTTSTVKVKTYTTLNIATGEVGGETEVEFVPTAMPKETFNTDYTLLSMNYILVPQDAVNAKMVSDIEFTFKAKKNGSESAFSGTKYFSVPLKRNYRTNILGSLLTKPTDFTVTIDAEFGGETGEIDGQTFIKVKTIEEFNEAFADNKYDLIILEDNIVLNSVVTRASDPIYTVKKGKELTIDLNGKKLSSTSTQIGKNYNMFDVRGTLTVKNGALETKHEGENMEWNNSTNIFNVTDGGVLNLEDITAKNLGGSDMAFVAHLNNWGEVTLNVENSTLESTYVPVRVFNSGNDMNNVTIKNSTLKGVSAAFWVHNYTAADFGSEEKAEAHKALLNLNIYNQGNTFSPDVNGIRYGFTNSVRADAYGITKSVSEDGTEVTLGSVVEDGLVRRGVAGAEENNTIKKVVVGEGITTLYDRTFRRFYALETVELPSTLTTIGVAGTGVFQSCTALKNIVIPESVTVLGKGTFQECSSLESINIPAGVTRIEENCLRATGLVKVEFHSGVTYFGAQAFRDCKQLKEVVINAPEFTIEGNTFGIMAAPFTPMTIYVANAEMKAYVESKLTAHAKTYITVVAPEAVSNAEQLTEALANGENVTLTQDIETEAATTAPYGNKYAFKLDGGVLDGNGHELHMECYGDDYGIMTSGGTIKNLTIKEGCRAVMIMYPQQDIILDNVKIGGNGVLYPINTGEGGAEGVDLIVTNSVIAGWTSYGLIASASFTNVEFKQGTYYNNIYGRVLKPYVNTTLTNCSFVKSMNLDLSALNSGHKITIKDCTVDGQVITVDTFTIPTSDAQYDTELFTVDLPSWATSINDCIVFE